MAVPTTRSALATLSRAARLLSLLRVPRRSCDRYERAADVARELRLTAPSRIPVSNTGW